MKLFFLFLFIALVKIGMSQINEPRLVIPIGHNLYDEYDTTKFSKSDNFVVTCEEHVLIVWSLPLMKEVYRKKFDNEVFILSIIGFFEHANVILLQVSQNKESMVLAVNYLKDQTEVFKGINSKKTIVFPKLNTFILGNVDTTYFFDIHDFEFVGKLPISVWTLSSFSKGNNQFGVNSNTGCDYILYRGSQKTQEESSLIIYNYKIRELKKIPLGCHALKAIALENEKFLIEKQGEIKFKGVKSTSGFYKAYVFDVKSESMIDSIEMHKYSILALGRGLSNELISSGGDQNLIFYNQNLKKIREFKIKQNLNIPVFRKFEIDTVLKTINFESALYKKDALNKIKKDSIRYTGKVDYYTLELITLKTDVIQNDSISIYSDSDFKIQNYTSTLHGIDVPLSLYRQDSSGILLNNGTIRITDDFQIIFQDSITFIPDIQLSNKDIRNVNIINKTIPGFNIDRAKVFKTVFSSNQLNDITRNYRRFNRENKKYKIHLEYEIKQDSYDSIFTWYNQQVDFKRKPNKNTVIQWFQKKYFSFSDDTSEYIHYFSNENEDRKILKPIKTSVYFENKLLFSTTDKVKILSDYSINYGSRNYTFYKKDKEIIQIEWAHSICDFQMGSGSIVWNDSLFLYLKKGKLIKQHNTGKYNYVVAANPNNIYFANFPLGHELIWNESNFFNLIFNDPNANFSFIDTLKNEEVVKKIDYFNLKIVNKKICIEKVDEIILEQNLKNIPPEKTNSRKKRIFEYGDIRLSTNLFNHYELVKSNDTTCFFVNKHEGNPFELLTQNDFTGGKNGPLIFANCYEEVLKQFYNFVEVPSSKRIYSNMDQKFLDFEFINNENEELIGVNEKHKLLILIDQNLNIINVRNYQKKLMFSILITEGNNYLFVDNESRYDGTKGAIDELYFLCGLEIIDLNQVKDSLYVPHLVKRILQGDEMKNVVTLKKLNICGITPIIEPINIGQNGSMKYRIIPRLGGLGSVELFINGISRKVFLPSEIITHNGIYYIEVDSMFISSFSDESNEIELKVIAKTANNSISSRGLITIKHQLVSSSNRKPSLFAVMIGVDDYKDNKLDLNYAAKDANDFHAALELASVKFFNVDDTNRVYFYNLSVDRNGKIGNDKIKGLMPDKGNVFNTLQEIEIKSMPEDILLVFFAGHGEIVDKDQLILLTTESTSTNFEGIRISELLNKLNKIPAGKRVLILDACHSGAAINNLEVTQLVGKRDVKDAERQSHRMKELDKLACKSGFAIITASSSDQKAIELPQYEHGLLTYALLKAMLNNKSSIDENNQLQLDKWLISTEEEVKSLNQDQNVERMVPVNFILGQIDDEVRASIVLKEKPTVFIENVLNKNTFNDNLHIKVLLVNAFHDLIRSTNKNIMIADLPNAIKVNVLYEEKGGGLKANVFLYKNNFEQNFEFTRKEMDIELFIAELMNQILLKIHE